MMHVVDWFPTLLSATGVSNTLKDIDGVNQWPIIRDGVGKAPRTGFVYNFDSKDEKLFGAIRDGDMKLIVRPQVMFSSWYSESEEHPENVKLYGNAPILLLYNITADPTEKRDLFPELKNTAKKLYYKLREQLAHMVPSPSLEDKAEGHPSRQTPKGVFRPGWCTAPLFKSRVVTPQLMTDGDSLHVCSAKLKAGCKVETLRACGDDYIPYGKEPRLGVPGEDFAKRCGIYKEQIACTKNFIKDCVDGASKAAALIVIETYKENVDDICNTNSKQYKAYEKAIGCLNSIGTKIQGCVKGVEENLQKAVLKAPRKDIIAHICCSFGGLVDCLDPVLTPCEKVGGKDFTINQVESVFAHAEKLVCGNYKRGSASCKALPKLPALGPHDRKVASYIELIIEGVDAIAPSN
ncbi:hypothetical protein HPB50_011877 [Hyalomma asiaticum]|uniref:Uncharacterized protein n=1 Tax=Hyalomma asiaticum TaxID=266040 RepID=A0ACB7RUP0_HYAAI|nr:hypothetical protein HPB50_011877 [Hyalomma asiaticum]